MDKKDIIFKILKYYYTDGLTQVEIATKLNITRVAVSRYLSKAKKDGLIEFKIKYPASFTMDKYDKTELELKKAFNLKECIIVPSHGNQMETLQELSYRLVELFDRIVSNNAFLGVGWGATLEKIANLMEMNEKKNIKVIPLIGGYGRLFDDQHSNNIAKLISEKFNGTCYVVNIPALFDTKEIKESIEKDSTATELFKLAKRVDTAVLCMGDLTTESSLYKTEQLNLEDLDYLKGLGIVGDINYIFLDKDGNFVPNEISERLTNIFPLELMKLTKNVVGIAVGTRKAKILRAVLKGNLINILLTDIDAATEVMKFN
jgi:Transcriptional regulator, contains sigma factor-related N-terminal domain